jgi:copper chaperone
MTSEAKKIVLAVEGMTCGGCMEAVKRVIRKADAAAEVSIALETGRVEAVTIAQASELAAAVTKAGYDAKVAG